MNYTLQNLKLMMKHMVLIILLLGFIQKLNSQTPTTITVPTGSFIVNMGIVPQTVANGLKPYGMVYALLNAQCPVQWVINTSKSKDGIDFSYNGVNYKGGTFIIDAKYRTAAVNSIISTWQGYGVVGVTNTTPISNVPLYLTFWNVPRWTMDKQNGGIAVNFFTYAGIPATAFGGTSSTYWDTPAMLDCCDDIFVMPHADPIWSTHRHLLEWNSNTGGGLTDGCKGAIWLGCHAGSALMDMFDNITTDGDPVNFNEQTNFLVDKTGPASGTGPYSENALLLWGNHDDGTLPYSYDYHGEPIMQFIGSIDAAQLNGSEQIYIPKSAGWFANTHVGVYDPDHPDRYPGVAPYTGYTDPKHRAATLAYGPGLGVIGNGKVMLESAHNISGTAPANVAAQRAFFNFSFLVAWEKAVLPDLSGLPDTLYSDNSYNMGYTLYFNTPGGSYALKSINWSANCGGTWNTSTSNPTVYTPPSVSSPQLCSFSVIIEDACGRKTFDTHQSVIAPCKVNSTRTIYQPSCYGGSDGSIAITSTNWASPYNWSWTRTNPAGGPTSGTGTTITGLSAGNYTVTLSNTSPACSGTFSAQITQPAQYTASATVTNASCYGTSTGSVNLTVVGGTPGYTYLWSPGSMTTEDLVNVSAGTYNLTVTDSRSCTATATATVGQPAAALTVPGTVTHVSCNGGSNGAINITAAGGTSPYTYNWGGGITDEDRNGLTPGTYNVIVTDANGCTATASFTVSQPNVLVLSTTVTQPTCDAAPPDFDGTITLTVTGGTAAYSYDWTDLGSSGEFTDPKDRTGLGPGTYSVTVRDANGCTATASATLTALHTDPVAPSIINH
jgi:hypothetical protein